MSKADTKEVQCVLDDELKSRLLEDVHGIQNHEGYYLPQFNAKEYTPIGRKLAEFMLNTEYDLAQLLKNDYLSYSYFALSN